MIYYMNACTLANLSAAPFIGFELADLVICIDFDLLIWWSVG